MRLPIRPDPFFKKEVGPLRLLTIDDLHTYYVISGDEAVLTHNCNGRLTTGVAGEGLPGSSPALDGNPWNPKRVDARIAQARADYAPTPPATPVNQMNAAIRRGQAPRGIGRVDRGLVKGEQIHVTIGGNVNALNIDGTWKHGGVTLTREQAEWLRGFGWKI